jgi:hypothetical protein
MRTAGCTENTSELFEDLLKRAQKADSDAQTIFPGELAKMVDGSTAMRSALDLGECTVRNPWAVPLGT